VIPSKTIHKATIPRELREEHAVGLSSHCREEDMFAVAFCQKPDAAIFVSQTSFIQKLRENVYIDFEKSNRFGEVKAASNSVRSCALFQITPKRTAFVQASMGQLMITCQPAHRRRTHQVQSNPEECHIE
jgi:hypothetical protein